ncbi:ABC transporter permease [Paenibacillus hamazuiensis]|uniref:ABC transporter permease n=1 Tax=Paenibacillus hamazuiensis TaxID=2936508 RepID=UPI00200D85E6|nr:ABC transporter permease [Paenibacillus hamazuiensis]
MASAIIQRLISSVLVVFGSLLLVFFILYLLPGDPVLAMLEGVSATPEAALNLRRQLGLDQPVGVQFAQYFWKLIHGDFGRSIISGDAVLPKIWAQFPATAALTAASSVVSLAVGVPLGVLSAVHHNRAIDLAARVVSLLGISMPTFWTGIVLILIFSVQLRWFPAMGSNGWKTLVLPALALGLVTAGYIVRMVRSSMLDILREQFIVTLRSKGLSERLVMYRHALRNALIPAVTMLGVQVGELLAGAVVTETVFSRQGIGRLLADAITAKDLPVVQGIILFTAIMYVMVNLIIDVSYSAIDPRVRRTIDKTR